MQPPFIADGASGGAGCENWVGANRPRAEKNQADRMLSEPTWFYAVQEEPLRDPPGKWSGNPGN